MRTRVIAFLALLIVFLIILPCAYGTTPTQSVSKTGILSSTNYTENLSLYLTSSETLWKIHLSGGNINISSIDVPSSVSGFSLTLTHYTSWQSNYEIFTGYGFGLLGTSEPYPNGALLVINASSASDANSLASSLSSRFALAFVQTISSGSSYAFFSPIDFNTVFGAYFYKIVPLSAGGFATLFTESQFENNALDYYQLSYSGSTYSLSIGGITTLHSDNFQLYAQLGLSQSSYNYSSSASASSIDIYILGGLIDNSSVPYTNHVSNISSTIEIMRSANNSIPNINATLNFSFPTIVAYRQVTPTLTPSTGSSVTVTITVTNVGSTSVGATANDVFVNDSWIYAQSANFHLTQTQTSNNETLSPGNSYSVIYAFNVTASSGTFVIPATPVTYRYATSNSTEAQGKAMLNSETMVVGGPNTPELEATASIVSGTQIQVGQPNSVNVTVVNKGSGVAFGLTSDGFSRQNLQPGSSWSFISNQSSSSLINVNESISYLVRWQDANGVLHSTPTNTIHTVLSYSSPGSPALSLTKTVGTMKSDQINVTISAFNGSPSTISGSSVKDVFPSGLIFGKSYNSSSIISSGNDITANLSSIAPQTTVIFVYSLNVSNSNNNFVFLPASVSTAWNNVTIIHYSGGYGLPLGVVATKVFTPNQGFQGANVSISIGLVNHGTLPIFQVSLNNTYDSFLRVLSSNSGYAAVLNSGSQLNAILSANLTGSPGVYNSSSSAASFIFAGENQTATSSAVEVTIFHLPEANLTYSATKVEEGHNIVISVTITNPSNATINNISYSITLPKDLRIVSGGSLSFTIPTLGPESSYVNNITIITNQPDVYSFNDSKLTFEYQGHQLAGVVGSLSLNINDDIPLRYGIPVLIGLAIVVATLIYVRRLTKPGPS
ncbi:MAG: hypothetical protein JRN20_08260 [Nitrososphaerota archaeon]|nr:hypothetical protein [Nitrososphaerota archaeon]